jgi:hypothetical protein
LADLWSFDPESVQWTWQQGRDISDRTGEREEEFFFFLIFITTDERGEWTWMTTPGSRSGVASWIGSDGKMRIFGGTKESREESKELFHFFLSITESLLTKFQQQKSTVMCGSLRRRTGLISIGNSLSLEVHVCCS